MKLLFFLLLCHPSFAAKDTIQNAKSNMDIKEFFNKFDKNNVDLADKFYHPNVEFNDPIVSIKGIENLKKYYANLYKNVTAIRFEFSSLITQGDEQVAVWVMYLKAKGLNGGNEVALKGNSHIRYKDGLAIYHRDYFDMGEFIYENIPVLGSIIRKIKSLLHP